MDFAIGLVACGVVLGIKITKLLEGKLFFLLTGRFIFQADLTNGNLLNNGIALHGMPDINA